MLLDMLDAYLPTAAAKSLMLRLLQRHVDACEATERGDIAESYRAVAGWLEGVPVRP